MRAVCSRAVHYLPVVLSNFVKVQCCAVCVADNDPHFHVLYRACSEKLAQTARSADFDPERTFAPAINDNSIRMAIAKEIRELQDNVPVPERLTQRQPLRVTQGGCHMSCRMVFGRLKLPLAALGLCAASSPAAPRRELHGGSAMQRCALNRCALHRCALHRGEGCSTICPSQSSPCTVRQDVF